MGILSNIVLFAFLVAACMTDLRSRRIPNGMIGAMVACWFAVEALAVGLGYATVLCMGIRIVGALLIGATLFTFTCAFERVTHAFAMGGGDIKLILAIALFLGFEGACGTLALACFLAAMANALQRGMLALRHRAVAGVGGFPTGSKGKPEALSSFPFAPFLAAATLVAFVL